MPIDLSEIFYMLVLTILYRRVWQYQLKVWSHTTSCYIEMGSVNLSLCIETIMINCIKRSQLLLLLLVDHVSLRGGHW